MVLPYADLKAGKLQGDVLLAEALPRILQRPGGQSALVASFIHRVVHLLPVCLQNCVALIFPPHKRGLLLRTDRQMDVSDKARSSCIHICSNL